MSIDQTLDELMVDYFTERPEEIDEYMDLIFSEYENDRNLPALLSSLRSLARVKGVSNIAKEVKMSRQGVQKALSANGNPRLGSFTAIVRAMGYRLMPQPVMEITAVAEPSPTYEVRNIDYLIQSLRRQGVEERVLETAVAESRVEYKTASPQEDE